MNLRQPHQGLNDGGTRIKQIQNMPLVHIQCITFFSTNKWSCQKYLRQNRGKWNYHVNQFICNRFHFRMFCLMSFTVTLQILPLALCRTTDSFSRGILLVFSVNKYGWEQIDNADSKSSVLRQHQISSRSMTSCRTLRLVQLFMCYVIICVGKWSFNNFSAQFSTQLLSAKRRKWQNYN